MRAAGRQAGLPADRLDALRAARPAPGVRLLPPGDPFLQGRDRDVLVPEKPHQKQLWRIIGNPGALLVDGEVAGVWRAKMAGRGALEVTVTPFDGRPLPARVRRELDAEAAVVAAAAPPTGGWASGRPDGPHVAAAQRRIRAPGRGSFGDRTGGTPQKPAPRTGEPAYRGGQVSCSGRRR